MNLDDTFDLDELVDHLDDYQHFAPRDDADRETLYEETR